MTDITTSELQAYANEKVALANGRLVPLHSAIDVAMQNALLPLMVDYLPAELTNAGSLKQLKKAPGGEHLLKSPELLVAFHNQVSREALSLSEENIRALQSVADSVKRGINA